MTSAKDVSRAGVTALVAVEVARRPSHRLSCYIRRRPGQSETTRTGRMGAFILFVGCRGSPWPGQCKAGSEVARLSTLPHRRPSPKRFLACPPPNAHPPPANKMISILMPSRQQHRCRQRRAQPLSAPENHQAATIHRRCATPFSPAANACARRWCWLRRPLWWQGS